MKPTPSSLSSTAEGFSHHSFGSASGGGYDSKTKRRGPGSSIPGAYPWLLLASTATAGVFCLMYITKPVIIARDPGPSPAVSISSTPVANPTILPQRPPLSGLMPAPSRLPGEPSPQPVPDVSPAPIQPPPLVNGHEETNLRMQHILTAKAPGNHVHRIDVDVPVIYQSRSLKWTSDQAEKARELLARLTDYQEKSRQLRAQGSELLGAWNSLIGESMPLTELRADSPSLPANQGDRIAGSGPTAPFIKLEEK
ncbi:MAG: hypothetical protein V4733_09910 [Verrucomicrobiota bacterium]